MNKEQRKREALKRFEESFGKDYDVVWDDAHTIERWSDYSFTTDDGRTFGVFANGNSRSDSIELRFRAVDAPVSPRAVEQLGKTAGFILEVGTTDPPLIFGDEEALRTAWLGLHQEHGVPLSDLEQAFFDAYYVNEEDEPAEN